MKNIIVTVLFALLISSPALGYQNEHDGFRGIKWGTDLFTITGMRPLEAGDTARYIRENDEMMFGVARLDKIVYTFTRNKLESVLVTARDYNNFMTLKLACFEKYGPVEMAPDEDDTEERYIWTGEVTDILLMYSKATKIGILQITPGTKGKVKEDYDPLEDTTGIKPKDLRRPPADYNY